MKNKLLLLLLTLVLVLSGCSKTNDETKKKTLEVNRVEKADNGEKEKNEEEVSVSNTYETNENFTEHGGIERSGEEALSYLGRSIPDGIDKYNYSHILTSESDDNIYIVMEAFVDGYLPYGDNYRLLLRWSKSQAYDPNASFPFNLEEVKIMDPLFIDEEDTFDYLWNILGEIYYLGLEYQNFSKPEEIDIEDVLDAYEYYEFNLYLAESMGGSDGEILMVDEARVEAYMYEKLKIQPDSLRRSRRYYGEEKAYAMEVLEGLGGMYSGYVYDAYRADKYLLLEIDFEDEIFSQNFLLDIEEDFYVMGGWRNWK